MKICVFGFESASADVIFQDERLSNLRRVMDAGLYGPLSQPASLSGDPWTCLLKSHHSADSPVPSIWQYLEQSGKNVVVLESGEELWETARSRMADPAWEGFGLVDRGLSQMAQSGDTSSTSDYCLALDEQIGSVMEMLDDQTILLIASAGSSRDRGFFLMVAPNSPISGEYNDASVLDLAPTLLDLAGYEVPQTVQGKSLVAGMEKRAIPQDEDEKIIYDRLAGLGYV